MKSWEREPRKSKKPCRQDKTKVEIEKKVAREKEGTQIDRQRLEEKVDKTLQAELNRWKEACHGGISYWKKVKEIFILQTPK